MLMLLFNVGEDRYALDSAQVVEVIPMVELKKIIQAPDYISGVFNYRGKSVPVLDLCRLMIARSSAIRLSTRVILVSYKPSGAKGQLRTVGLLAEKITETVKVTSKELVQPGLKIERLPFLDKLFKIGDEMIQCIDLSKLMESVELIDTLFS